MTVWPKMILVAILAISLSACAVTPDSKVERGLYRDLRVVVDTRQRTSWIIDQVEFEASIPVALQSLCQTPLEHRQGLKRWLDEVIEGEGGLASLSYRESGSMDGHEEALTLERVKGLLDYAESREAECPFWLEPDDSFEAIQSDSGRFVLLLESRGGGDLFIQGGEVAVGGGGGGRLLPAYGLGEGLTMGLGVEVGGGGAISEQDGVQSLDATVRLALPVLMRFSDLTQLFDIELALATMFTPDRMVAAPGPRLQLATGVLTYRVGAFMPTALVTLGVTYHPAAYGAEEMWVAGVGTRVGVDVAP